MNEIKQEYKTRTALTSLFLQQSMRDSEADYARSLTNPSFPHFDLIVLTASNEHQAGVFRTQLAQRRLPCATEFAVIPDKNGERVGSGGATLAVIKYVKEKYGRFRGLRIAVIHSGGDGKRMPNYSAMGKVFSPVPRLLPDGRSSTLFDEFLISIASIPGQIREGMLILSGDVLLLFNPLQIDFSGHGAAAISFKESVETGVNHGVYLAGRNETVAKFLHKQSRASLEAAGAVNAQGNVSIDTGAVIFAPDLLEKLSELVVDPKGEDRFINPNVRLSLYADFLFPLAEDSTLEAYYRETPEWQLNDALHEARTVLWQILRPFRLKLLTLSPAKFIHFGTTRELMALVNNGWREYAQHGWQLQINSCVDKETAAYNSVVSPGATIGAGTYLEYAYIHHNAKIGENCLISFVDIHDEEIPDNVALHCLKQTDGRFVCRIYGIGDNPKEARLFGRPLTRFGFTETALWDAGLYPVCKTVRQAVASALNLYRLAVTDDGDWSSWHDAEKTSLRDGFNNADPQALTDWQTRMHDLALMFDIETKIARSSCVSDINKQLYGKELTPIQKEWLDHRVSELDLTTTDGFAKAIRLYRFTAAVLDSEEYRKRWFRLISDVIQKHTLDKTAYDSSMTIANTHVCVKLPLRVNWGGGWSDTPPYCIENGGTVLNCAITLNGENPVCVTIDRIDEAKIVFDSRDMNVHGEFLNMEDLQDLGDPYDPFALQKACLIACGVVPRSGGNMSDFIARIGGGFEMHSEVVNVPKGSGLGTSSILSAACVKAVFAFFGRQYNEEALYGFVLAMEQIMSTGGGWQDQIGGLTPGVKMITSRPGVEQHPQVEHVELNENVKNELNERFCLIYTGQRRLARNLLRDVISRYVGNEPESINAHQCIRELAELMKTALCRGDIDAFSALLNEHLEMSKIINPETVNTLIEYIFLSVDDLIDGKFVCGAGGGGFLQVILKRGVTEENVHKRLKEVFQDYPVDVWNCELLFD